MFCSTLSKPGCAPAGYAAGLPSVLRSMDALYTLMSLELMTYFLFLDICLGAFVADDTSSSSSFLDMSMEILF
jgi:hypothetical protein